MAQPAKKKLYFDVLFQGTTGIKIFPCTSFRDSWTGDRYGNVLQVLESLTGNSTAAMKAKQAITAVFQMSGNASASPLTVTSVGATPFAVDFVQPTTGNGSNALVTRLRSYNSAGTLQTALAGSDAIYGTLGTPRHFATRVRRLNVSGAAVSSSVRGVLYVQRQHDMEV